MKPVIAAGSVELRSERGGRRLQAMPLPPREARWPSSPLSVDTRGRTHRDSSSRAPLCRATECFGLARLLAGEAAVVLMTEICGASNAKAQRALGSTLRYLR